MEYANTDILASKKIPGKLHIGEIEVKGGKLCAKLFGRATDTRIHEHYMSEDDLRNVKKAMKKDPVVRDAWLAAGLTKGVISSARKTIAAKHKADELRVHH